MQPGLLGRKTRFVPGGAGHFPADEHRPLEQKAGLLLFDDVEAAPPNARRLVVGISSGSRPGWKVIQSQEAARRWG
jgi:hypothetical protein